MVLKDEADFFLMVRWLSVSQEGKKILPEKEQSKRILKHRFNGELHKLRHEMGIGNSQIKKVNKKNIETSDFRVTFDHFLKSH